MDNVLLQADTLEVVGVNRPALPFQVSVNVPQGFNPSKIVQIHQGIHHKRNELGQKLFFDGEEEVIYSEKAVAFEKRPIQRTLVLENGKKVTEEVMEYLPTGFEQLMPVYVPFYQNTLVHLLDNPTVFTYSDILQAKQEAIARAYGKEFIYFNEDMDGDAFSTGLASFSADLGFGVAILHGRGQLRTNKITLPSTAASFTVYAEVQPDVVVEVGFNASEFVEAVDEIAIPEGAKDIYVRFTNRAEGKREIQAFGILV